MNYVFKNVTRGKESILYLLNVFLFALALVCFTGCRNENTFEEDALGSFFHNKKYSVRHDENRNTILYTFYTNQNFDLVEVDFIESTGGEWVKNDSNWLIKEHVTGSSGFISKNNPGTQLYIVQRRRVSERDLKYKYIVTITIGQHSN